MGCLRNRKVNSALAGMLALIVCITAGPALAERLCKNGDDAVPPFTSRVASTDHAITEAKEKLKKACEKKGGKLVDPTSCTLEADYGGEYIGSYTLASCCAECQMPATQDRPAESNPVRPTQEVPRLPDISRIFQALP